MSGRDVVSKEQIFAGLAQVPGVGYKCQPGIDRQALARVNAKPRISTYDFDGKPRTCVSWELPGGVTTSQSPASAWATSGAEDDLWPNAVRKLYEALELPGSASDYHFALLRTTEVLWGRRRQDPEVLPELERLCLLDIMLLEARPEIARGETGDGQSYGLYVPAFGYLVRLYEQEGLIEDALDIARRGTALGQGPAEVERLKARLKDMEAEHAS